MAGSIPQSFIDALLARTDIVDVIDRRVPLKKTGREFGACCPFHNEKTPSFTVSPLKQFYYCFGCGAHGTAISFLMDYEHLSFVEAIEDLAKLCGLEVPYTDASGHAKQDELQPLYKLLEEVSLYFQRQLREHPAAETAKSYLKQRGLTGETARSFEVGFAPPGWDNLKNSFTSTPLLLQAGLIARKDESKYYDRFRNRIMFPIRDRRGRVIGFGGRIIDPNDTPKYLNSPETPVFHKSHELYGLYQARQHERKLQRLLIVEGYMDVIALAQFDIHYAVATLGTATSKDHLDIAFRSVDDVVFCFDGDNAGRKAAWRALEVSLATLSAGRQVSYLFLPDGEDPDTLVRKEGKAAFEQRIRQAMPLADFMLQGLSDQADLTRVDGKARFINELKPLLSKVQDSVLRELLVVAAANHAKIERGLIERTLNTIAEKSSFKQDFSPSNANTKTTVTRSPLQILISILVQHPRFAQDVANRELLQTIDVPGMTIFLKLLEILEKDTNLSTAALLERWRGTDDFPHIARLAQRELHGNEESLRAEFAETLAFLLKQLTKQRWEFLQQKLLREGLSDAEKMEYSQLLVTNSR